MKSVSMTAFYCCGARMQDAESPKPLVGDDYARRLMSNEGLAYWESFKRFAKPNAGNTVRHYLIDRHVQSALKQHPGMKVVLVGAGLDSRAYRFSAGNWIELDEPAMIDYKNSALPIGECQNPLQRIPIDFSKEKLIEKLKPLFDSSPVMVIVEGVFMYLSLGQTREMLQALQTAFPHHTLLADLMTKRFFSIFSKKIHDKLVETGTKFQDLDDHPNNLFLEQGYRQLEVTSTIKAGVDLGMVKIPKVAVNYLFSKLMMGYSVYKFEYEKTP